MTTKNDRPLSPHLQIYRLPLTALLSISHRITGVALSLGLLLLVWLLAAAAGGADSYATVHGIYVLGAAGALTLLTWIVALAA